jgi:hypothetical protein
MTANITPDLQMEILGIAAAVRTGIPKWGRITTAF